MANYVIEKNGKLPKRTHLTKETMSEFIKANGKKADMIWLKDLFDTHTKTTTVYCRDEHPTVSAPDLKVIRKEFLKRFFAEELANEKAQKQADRETARKEKRDNFFDDLIKNMED